MADMQHNDIYFDAGWMYENVLKQINDFEKDLDEETEASVHLAYFGSAINMKVQRIGFQDPHLLYFCGTVNGEQAQLIQHMSQLSFLLVAEKRPDPETPARRLGFECKWEIDCDTSTETAKHVSTDITGEPEKAAPAQECENPDAPAKQEEAGLQQNEEEDRPAPQKGTSPAGAPAERKADSPAPQKGTTPADAPAEREAGTPATPNTSATQA